MIRQQTISAPEFEVGRRLVLPADKRRRRLLLIAATLSVAVHVLAALFVVLLPRVLPNEARPQEQGTVELLMVEQKGAEPGQPTRPQEKTPAPPQPAPANPTPPAAQKEASRQPPPAPPVAVPGDEPATPPTAPAPPKYATADAQPAPMPADSQPPQKQADTQSVPPRPQDAPVFNLEGTDSESNATALGERILPAMKDDRFRNRPPAYPSEAQMLGQHGEVVVVIHVSENGLANGADVLQSSGFNVLDQAALTAVRKWHFRPAMREGRSIPFDMPFRFIFEPY